MDINDQLFAAAQHGNLVLVINSLAQGADVDAVHNIGVTSLYIASQNGHSAVVELLLKKGADPEFKFPVNDMTPLCNAAYNGKTAVVQVLLNYGADIEAKVGSATVLHLAAQNGQRAVVKLLLENGASLTPPSIIPTQEQTMLEVLLQQGRNTLKTVGCYDGLSSEVFASEGIDYDKQNKLLQENSFYLLEHINEYTGRKTIPLITHQIYFTSQQSPREIDDLSLNKMILSAKRLNEVDSGWKHYIWTNNPGIIPKSFSSIKNVEVRNIDELQDSKQYTLIKRMLSEGEINRSFFAKVSDVFRYIVLNKFGGVYHDLDYEIYSAEKLLEYIKYFDFIGGKELDKEFSAIGNSFIASIKAHPIISEAIELSTRNLDQNIDRPDYIKYPCSNWHKTWFDTGPALISSAVYKSANNGTLDVILPSNVLYNVEYARSNAPGSRCYDPNKIVKTLAPETIGADMFCGSWSATENFLNPIYYEKNIDAYLFEAASLGYTRIVEYFLNKGANPNYISAANMMSSLYIAAASGNNDLVKLLLSKDAEVDVRIEDGSTALYGAALAGKFDVIKTLLEEGADTEISVKLGHTPLYVAIHNNRLDIAELLLQYKANPGYDSRFTPFYLAEMLENKEAYKLLRSYYLKNLKTDSKAKVGFAVFIVRYEEPIEEVMEWALLEFPNDKVTIINKGEGDFLNLPGNYKEVKKDNTGYFGGEILRAIIDNYDDLPKELLFLQADPYASPIFTPLGRYKGSLNSTCSNIVGKCSTTTLQATTDFLKNFDWENDKHGRYKKFKKLDYDHMGFVHKYLSPNYTPSTEVDVLDGAQFMISSEKILLHPKSVYEKMRKEAFADKFSTADHSLEKVWPLLFQKFPESISKNKAITVNAMGQYLFEAAKNGHIKSVETILKAGANIEYATAGGHTPLYAAIHEGKIETVEYLIKMGANITDNAHRFTPFFIASTFGLNRNASPVQKQVHKIVKAAYDKVLAEFHKQPVLEGAKNTDYVFARYNEPIDRIKEELPKDNDVVFIYNKGEEITNYPSHWTIEKPENKGLDPQAYLQHIVDHYDDFVSRGVERVALFQGMPDDHPAYFPLKLYATNITSNCDNTIGKCEKTTIQTELDNMDHTIKTEGWKTFDGGKYANVVIREYSLERYINELICPFPKDMEYTINWGNQFAVDVDVIMRHPKEYYQRILDRMDIQFPAEVHFFERTNDLMFAPCPYEKIDIDYAGEVAL